MKIPSKMRSLTCRGRLPRSVGGTLLGPGLRKTEPVELLDLRLGRRVDVCQGRVEFVLPNRAAWERWEVLWPKWGELNHRQHRQDPSVW